MLLRAHLRSLPRPLALLLTIASALLLLAVVHVMQVSVQEEMQETGEIGVRNMQRKENYFLTFSRL